MKNSELNRKNAGATGIVYKACVWILSIMLVVTGMAPSFARNVNADKGSATASAKSVSNVKEHAKTKEVNRSRLNRVPVLLRLRPSEPNRAF